MAVAIVQKMPYYGNSHFIDVMGGQIEILGHQIIVWVSVVPVGVDEFQRDQPVFPAILLHLTLINSFENYQMGRKWGQAPLARSQSPFSTCG